MDMLVTVTESVWGRAKSLQRPRGDHDAKLAPLADRYCVRGMISVRE